LQETATKAMQTARLAKIAQEAAGNAITFSSTCFGGKIDLVLNSH
jgi:hypothetical protein